MAIPALLAEVRLGNFWSRTDALEALEKFEDPSVAPVLAGMLDRSDDRTQDAILRTLSRLCAP